MTRLHLDFETRSCADLKRVGAHRYAEDPTTEILCLSYRVGDGPVRRWRPGDDFAFNVHLTEASAVVAHNAAFERAIWNGVMPRYFNRALPKLAPERQDCTLARAVALALPISLEELGSALNAPVQKDKDGHRLMMKMARPRGRAADGSITWWEAPEDVERLHAYCDQDVRSECAIDASLPPLSPRERRVWELDQRINDRGVAVDVPLVRKALAAVEAAKARADRDIWRATDGLVRKTTEVSKIVDWLRTRGHNLASLAEGDMDEILGRLELLEDDQAAAVVGLRRSAAKTFKFPAMLDCVCADGRVRGSLAYHGTLTGRWAGRGIQPQNFKRLGDGDEETVAAALAVLQSADTGAAAADALDDLVGPPLEVLSLCSRAMLVAAPGKRFIGGDFSNIEGRAAAWLAGETWKIEAFKAYDRGEGPDLYKVMAAAVTGKDAADLTRDDRQTRGKVPELACGYQGGVHAFQKMAYTQRPPVRITDEAAGAIVRTWRERNPRVVEAWADLQQAAIDACDHPGCVVSAVGGRVAYVKSGDFLFCKLPSGRAISYAAPVVEWKRKIITIDGEEIELNRRGVSFWGTKMGRWRKQDLYGGAQWNHVVQGLCRDLLVDAMLRVEEAGYPIVLTVHDEILAEVDEDFGDVNEFERLMSASEPWAAGLPVVTKAWTERRYVK